MRLRPVLALAATCALAPLAGSAATFTSRIGDSPRSADAWISSGIEAAQNFGAENRLRVRHHTDTTNIRHRKSYLRFCLQDLPFPAGEITDARLELALITAQPGTYRVWAIRDGFSGDVAGAWTATGLTWNNAPHNDTASGTALDPAGAELLGTFVVTSGAATASFRASQSPALLQALRADTNGLVTLVLTQQDGGFTSVEFASSRHSMLARPALIVSNEALPPPPPPPLPPALSGLRPHPRLLWDAAGEAATRALLASDPLLPQVLEVVVAEAEAALSEPVIQYRFDDPNSSERRLKDERRASMYRIFNLGVAWRLTGDARFADRAKADLLAAAAFPDWAPDHFLNVGELSLLMAVGYDWFHAAMSESERAAVRQGLVSHGLNPGHAAYQRRDWWLSAQSNWNQVCNGGLLLGALAVAEHHPELAASIVNSAVASLPAAMQAFLPDGAWQEGPTYWAYGTTYNALAIAALHTALGHAHGLDSGPAYAALGKSGAYHIQTVGPTNHYFNYGDSKSIAYFSPVLFWLSHAFNQPVYAWFERQLVEGDLPRMRSGQLMQDDSLDRFLGLLVVWFNPAGQQVTYDDLPLDQLFTGSTSLAAMRGSWGGRDSLYLAFKGGWNRAEHGHMDLGSFVLDALGERWAIDLGTDSYELPGYFDFNGGRWQYYRLNNLGHNTLAINNALQVNTASAAITGFHSTPALAHATVNLDAAYAGQASSVRRGFALLDRSRVLIEDRFTGVPAGRVLRWAMHTRASVTVNGGAARLTQNGKQLEAQILHPAGASFVAEPATPSGPGGQNPNLGVTRLLVRHTTVSADERIVVLLTPLSAETRGLPWPGFRPLTPAAAPTVPDYGAWSRFHLPFGSAAERAPGADPAGVGTPNLLAFALGVNPGERAPVTTHASEGWLSLAFQRVRADLDYLVETSTDLSGWSPLALNPGVVGEETSVSVPLTPDEPRRFLRLVVEPQF